MFVDGTSIAFDGGAIAGSVFRRGSILPVTTMATDEAALLVAGHGQYLLDAHWGGYVGLIEGATDIHLVRAPLGDLPCLMQHEADYVAIASDIALLEAIAGRVPIHWPALARHLSLPDLRRAETCLAGVTELQGGLRLRLGDGSTAIDEAWSPWRFAERDRSIENAHEAAGRLRNAILHTVAASCQPHGTVVLRLSGGLDSSIVAAALHQAGIETTALNLVTNDPSGDERRYARLIAEAFGMHLIEEPRVISAVDMLRSAAANQPRPIARAFVQAATGPAYAVAGFRGCSAIVDGGGGDNVFCSLQSMRPVADCLIAGVSWSRTADTARSMAILAQVSRWTILRRAYLARARRVSRYSFTPNVSLLSADAEAEAHAAGDHRWLAAPVGALPGKAAHIGIIASAQSVVESFDPTDPIPLVSPLISQPVVEACIRVPTWLWYHRGYNRAVARRAFADLLPQAIVERRSKGGPDSFIAALYRENRALIREHLLEGRLTANGLLDRDALDKATSVSGPVRGTEYFRIMRLFDAEIWARSR